MPPKFYAKKADLTPKDYDAALAIVTGMDETIKLLAQKFDGPRVLIVSTMLSDAHRELSEKREALLTQEGGDSRDAS
jgi:hypothetical protein